MPNHRIVAELSQGKMTNTFHIVGAEQALRPNFVICCKLGDWSGFCTLAQCQKRYTYLETLGRPDGYFWVEER